MSEQQISDEDVAEFQEFMEHPWVQAAKAGVSIHPIPTSVGLEPYDFEMDDGSGEMKEQQAALLTIIDPSGVKTVFISPQLVQHLMGLCAALLQNWSDKPQKGLIVPNANQKEQAKQLHKQQSQIKRTT